MHVQIKTENKHTCARVKCSVELCHEHETRALKSLALWRSIMTTGNVIFCQSHYFFIKKRDKQKRIYGNRHSRKNAQERERERDKDREKEIEKN